LNFAFTTLLLVLISLPGFSFRRGYYSGRFILDFKPEKIFYELLLSFLISLLFHTFWIYIVQLFLPVNFENLGFLLIGGDDFNRLDGIFNNIHFYVYHIFSYFLSISIIPYALGRFVKNKIREHQIDIKFPMLRYPNDWHYILSNDYVTNSTGYIDSDGNADFIVLDILVNNGKESVIYSGILEEYYLSRTDKELDKLILVYPSKKTYSSEGESEFRDIPGNFLVVPYKHVLNLNITCSMSKNPWTILIYYMLLKISSTIF
jgi:hypothetical protein